MNTNRIKQLLEKYFEGQTSLEEEKELHAFFEQGKVPEELKSYQAQFNYFQSRKQIKEAPFDPFAKIDFEEPKQAQKSNRDFYRIAAGFLFLLMSFSIGLMLGRYEFPKQNETAALRAEVENLRSVLISGTYRNISASERILAVKQSSTISQADDQITDILIYVMNNDENVNVRMEAAEALAKFGEDRKVKKALAHSLTQQKDPTVQIALINLLVDIKAKSATQEMKRMLLDSDVREEVKPQLEAAIASLNT